MLREQLALALRRFVDIVHLNSREQTQVADRRRPAICILGQEVFERLRVAGQDRQDIVLLEDGFFELLLRR